MSLSGVSGTALNIFILIIIVIIVIAILTSLFYFWHVYQKYSEFDCIIYSFDGFGKAYASKDKAGIFVDGKTKNKRLFVKKHNVGLDPDNVPFIVIDGKKTVFLLKTGLKNFRFLSLPLSKEKLENENIFSLKVGEEDVNWAINSYERQKKIFMQSTLMQLIPFLTIAFVSLIILILFIYFFKEFDTLKEVAVAMKEASRTLASAQTGTTVVGG